VLGLSVDALDLPLSYYYSKVRLTHAQTVDNWPCAAGDWVEFTREVATRLQPSKWQFERCTLAAHSVVAGVSWPANSWVYADKLGWLLSNEQPAEPALSFVGLPLRELRLSLAACRT
jgi:hypothetical protein